MWPKGKPYFGDKNIEQALEIKVSKVFSLLRQFPFSDSNLKQLQIMRQSNEQEVKIRKVEVLEKSGKTKERKRKNKDD